MGDYRSAMDMMGIVLSAIAFLIGVVCHLRKDHSEAAYWVGFAIFIRMLVE